MDLPQGFGETLGDFYGGIFMWLFIGLFVFFFPFSLPASECFFRLRGCAEAFAETRGNFFGHSGVSLFLEIIPPPPMSDLFFRWVDFADAFGEWRAEFYFGFFVAFYWAVFFGCVDLPRALVFFVSPFQKIENFKSGVSTYLPTYLIPMFCPTR